MSILVIWIILGTYWFFRKYSSNETYPVDTKKITFYIDILLGGPIVWILSGIYLLNKND